VSLNKTSHLKGTVQKVTNVIETGPLKQQHPFNGLYSMTTWVNWYQKSRTIRDFTEARDNGNKSFE